MKNINLSLFLFLCMFSFSSCEDFLDSFPGDKITDNNFWKTETDAQKMLTDVYQSTFPTSNIFWMECMSDNSFLVHNWWGGQRQVANGSLTAYGETPTEVWKARYAGIRKCWYLLDNIDKVPFSNAKDKEVMIAEVRCMLAYHYHMLITYFGDVPLIKSTLTLAESKELVRTPRKEVQDYILGELDKAATVLQSEDMEWGHITWGTCQALKARIHLYDSNFEKVLEIVSSLKGNYQLNTEGETPYDDLFNGNAKRSSEIIFSVGRTQKVGSLSIGHEGNGAMLLKGMSGGDPYCGIMPTGSVVDAYPMADGRLIKESGSTYKPASPYTDRDPRFYQSIIYPSGQSRYLDAETNSIKTRVYDPEDASSSTPAAQLYNANEPSPTGYMWNKYIDWSLFGIKEIWDCTNDIIIFRYADILLMEAEALCELQGAGAKVQICNIIDQLRDRCKGGRVHRENYNTKQELTHLIRNERRIELANEGLRYFDLIRWKDAEKDMNTNGYGLPGNLYGAYMRLDGIGKDDRTVLVDGVPRRYVEVRYFDTTKHYLFPIPQAEIDLNENLKQNPNW